MPGLTHCINNFLANNPAGASEMQPAESKSDKDIFLVIFPVIGFVMFVVITVSILTIQRRRRYKDRKQDMETGFSKDKQFKIDEDSYSIQTARSLTSEQAEMYLECQGTKSTLPENVSLEKPKEIANP
ncbi:hypothetical protein CC78DRAFT_583865 [Lojkania enalia]|uniref:Uncharacterized protein n=1 Tax=Lojkania enalia TaxID=147567 RepID=A0A9P4K4E9_9PLEO|nr:hypothetical protein CC78DRAFT_583865 [Didymosphaeria enalia]